MAYSLQAQTLQFLRAGALGLALGLHYDLLRALRRVHPRLTVPADLWFCLTALLSVLLLAFFGAEGQVHLFMLVGLLLGGCAWFSGPGRPVLRFLTVFSVRSMALRRRICGKIKNFAKRPFQTGKNRLK